MTDFLRFCLNKHTSGIPHGAFYAGRGSVLGNQFRTTAAGGQYKQGQAVAAYEYWLAQPEQAHILRQIDRWANTKLVCFCAPKLCHTNVIAFLANSNRETRINWWRYMRSLDRPREIHDHNAWNQFVCTSAEDEDIAF